MTKTETEPLNGTLKILDTWRKYDLLERSEALKEATRLTWSIAPSKYGVLDF